MHECVDCAALPELPGDPLIADEDVEYQPVRPRPAPHGGPRSRRCTTHYWARQRAAKKAAHDARVARTYGLERGEYEVLLAYQGGKCAICRVSTGRAKRLAVDHDHASGTARGILCGRCNHELLGRYDEAALQRAIDYLNDPPYEQMKREAS